MNIIDLQPFCGKDHDLRSPMRCAYGIVATNRKIMICIRDDGRDAVLQALPECRIGVKSPTDMVAVTFNGGFGAVMP